MWRRIWRISCWLDGVVCGDQVDLLVVVVGIGVVVCVVGGGEGVVDCFYYGFEFGFGEVDCVLGEGCVYFGCVVGDVFWGLGDYVMYEVLMVFDEC